MTFDVQRILESKRAHREQLASRLIVEKLQVLDSMRERELAIRGNATRSTSAIGILREEATRNQPEPG